ncbi:MAG: hypothetical protein M1820_009983 [Bogoriella megaspora]|nr:MAG: hypothetical protein M1820_009983 [Bogoriella megaspora]
MAFSIPAQVIAGVGIHVQTMYRINSLPGQMNEQLFKPQALYVLVILCDPQQRKQKDGIAPQYIEINQQAFNAIAKYHNRDTDK